MDVTDLLQQLSDAAAELVRRSLVLAAGGNVSLREGDKVYISPTGARLDALTPRTFAAVDVNTGEPLNAFRPSSELPMHLACYRARPDARAVIHCHPAHIIALASLGEPLPAMTADFLVYLNATSLPLIPYMTPGTKDLARAVEREMRSVPVVMLGNHGLIATGPNVARTLDRVLLAEESARVYLLARRFGEPRVLTQKDWDDLKRRYGRGK